MRELLLVALALSACAPREPDLEMAASPDARVVVVELDDALAVVAISGPLRLDAAPRIPLETSGTAVVAFALEPLDWRDAEGEPIAPELLDGVQLVEAARNIPGACGSCPWLHDTTGPGLTSPGARCAPPPFVPAAVDVGDTSIDATVVIAAARRSTELVWPGACEAAFAPIAGESTPQVDGCAWLPAEDPWSFAVAARGPTSVLAASRNDVTALEIDLATGQRTVQAMDLAGQDLSALAHADGTWIAAGRPGNGRTTSTLWRLRDGAWSELTNLAQFRVRSLATVGSTAAPELLVLGRGPDGNGALTIAQCVTQAERFTCAAQEINDEIGCLREPEFDAFTAAVTMDNRGIAVAGGSLFLRPRGDAEWWCVPREATYPRVDSGAPQTIAGLFALRAFGRRAAVCARGVDGTAGALVFDVPAPVDAADSAFEAARTAIAPVFVPTPVACVGWMPAGADGDPRVLLADGQSARLTHDGQWVDARPAALEVSLVTELGSDSEGTLALDARGALRRVDRSGQSSRLAGRDQASTLAMLGVWGERLVAWSSAPPRASVIDGDITACAGATRPPPTIVELPWPAATAPEVWAPEPGGRGRAWTWVSGEKSLVRLSLDGPRADVFTAQGAAPDEVAVMAWLSDHEGVLAPRTGPLSRVRVDGESYRVDPIVGSDDTWRAAQSVGGVVWIAGDASVWRVDALRARSYATGDWRERTEPPTAQTFGGLVALAPDHALYSMERRYRIGPLATSRSVTFELGPGARRCVAEPVDDLAPCVLPFADSDSPLRGTASLPRVGAGPAGRALLISDDGAELGPTGPVRGLGVGVLTGFAQQARGVFAVADADGRLFVGQRRGGGTTPVVEQVPR